MALDGGDVVARDLEQMVGELAQRSGHRDLVSDLGNVRVSWTTARRGPGFQPLGRLADQDGVGTRAVVGLEEVDVDVPRPDVVNASKPRLDGGMVTRVPCGADDRVGPWEHQALLAVAGPLHQVGRRPVLVPDLDDPSVARGPVDLGGRDDEGVSD